MEERRNALAVLEPGGEPFRIVGGTKTKIGAVNVDAGGVARLKITPDRNASYQAGFPGGAGTLPSTDRPMARSKGSMTSGGKPFG